MTSTSTCWLYLEDEAKHDVERVVRWARRGKPGLLHFQMPAGVAGPPPSDACMGIGQRCGTLAVDLLSLQILHNERGLPADPTLTMVDGAWRDDQGHAFQA